jgi:hypothetical protein
VDRKGSAFRNTAGQAWFQVKEDIGGGVEDDIVETQIVLR